MNLSDARQLLGLVNGYTVDDVRFAFSRAVKAAHPDAGGTGGDMTKLRDARDLLLGAKKTCVPCKGRGRILGRMGSVMCSRCNGDGTV